MHREPTVPRWRAAEKTRVEPVHEVLPAAQDTTAPQVSQVAQVSTASQDRQGIQAGPNDRQVAQLSSVMHNIQTAQNPKQLHAEVRSDIAGKDAYINALAYQILDKTATGLIEEAYQNVFGGSSPIINSNPGLPEEVRSQQGNGELARNIAALNTVPRSIEAVADASFHGSKSAPLRGQNSNVDHEGFTSVPFTGKRQTVNIEPQLENEASNNRYAFLRDFLDSDENLRLFPQDYDLKIRRQVRDELSIKENEWEQTKRRLEAKLKEDMEKRRKEQNNGKNSDNAKKDQVHQDASIPACKEVWSEDEDNQAIVSVLARSSAPKAQDSKVQTQCLDSDTIYWDEVEEVFVHASAM